MSDETTLLPCPFCGGEAEIIEADYGMYLTGYAIYCRKCCLKLGVTGRLGETYEWSPVFDTEAEAITAWNTRTDYHGYEQAAIEAWKSIKAWNTRATHGTLKAEQVREAVEASTWAETSTIREFNDSSWQAIADELNAELGSGTCENEWAQFGKFRCSECWLQVDSISTNTTASIPIKHCPNCGAKVVAIKL